MSMHTIREMEPPSWECFTKTDNEPTSPHRRAPVPHEGSISVTEFDFGCVERNFDMRLEMHDVVSGEAKYWP